MGDIAQSYPAYLQELAAAAKAGDAEALYQLGQAWEVGRGIAQDSALAYECYRTATALGHDRALHALIRLSGEGPNKAGPVLKQSELPSESSSVDEPIKKTGWWIVPAVTACVVFILTFVLLSGDQPISYRGRRAWAVRLVRELFGDVGVVVLVCAGAAILAAIAADAVAKRVTAKP